jgi:hypothetical protein
MQAAEGLESMLTLLKAQLDEIISHAREANPCECCGLVSGTSDGWAQTVYRLRNVAAEPLVTYEAAPEEISCILPGSGLPYCGTRWRTALPARLSYLRTRKTLGAN